MERTNKELSEIIEIAVKEINIHLIKIFKEYQKVRDSKRISLEKKRNVLRKNCEKLQSDDERKQCNDKLVAFNKKAQNLLRKLKKQCIQDREQCIIDVCDEFKLKVKHIKLILGKIQID